MGDAVLSLVSAHKGSARKMLIIADVICTGIQDDEEVRALAEQKEMERRPRKESRSATNLYSLNGRAGDIDGNLIPIRPKKEEKQRPIGQDSGPPSLLPTDTFSRFARSFSVAEDDCASSL
mgnify:FL=1